MNLKVISGQYLSAFNLVTADGYLEPLDSMILSCFKDLNWAYSGFKQEKSISSFSFQLESFNFIELNEVVVYID